MTGRVALEASEYREAEVADPAARFRDRARRFLESGPRGAVRQGTTTIVERRLPTEIVLLTTALEITVHTWDISRARGERRPIPEPLALELALVVPLLFDEAQRPGLFAAPVPVPRGTPTGDRLVAFLGRDPAAA